MIINLKMSQSDHSIQTIQDEIFNPSQDEIFHPSQAEQAEQAEQLVNAENLYYKTYHQYQPSIFDTKFGLINLFMTILYGELPSYCYYESDAECYNFFESIDPGDILKIYDILVAGGYINQNIITSVDFMNNFESYIESFCEPVSQCA